MKTFLGFALLFLGIAAGLYCGVWWAFVGGIIQCVTAIRAETLVGFELGVGIVKVLFSGVIGYGSAALLCAPALVILHTQGYSMKLRVRTR